MAQSSEDKWLASVEKQTNDFATKHALLLKTTERQLSASFEIGCFHALITFYELEGFSIKPAGLVDGAYRYLITPSGNPENFSFVKLRIFGEKFELRQQVRIKSHVDPEIAFTPDLVVILSGAKIQGEKKAEFAGGKRFFFTISSTQVLAAHECKSTNPFPELLISFIGMLVAAHEWFPNGDHIEFSDGPGAHLAPTLFVGGTARALHLKMIKAMQKSYGMNIVCGMHEGTWGLKDVSNRIKWK